MKLIIISRNFSRILVLNFYLLNFCISSTDSGKYLQMFITNYFGIKVSKVKNSFSF